MTTLPDPILVADPKRFAETVAALAKEPVIAVDTESNSLFAYREQVCLIQFSTPSTDYLVDPLTIDDISTLGELFSNPNIQKIFHAAEYDLLCLKRDFGFTFANLFDTMVAARILGIEKVGLGNMLESMFNKKLEKRFQKADWGKRPLPPKMLAYARLDTHYLISLRGKLETKLKGKNRWPIAQEDFARLSQVNGTPPGPVETNIWRINGSRDLSPQQAAVLQELANYRDEKAKSYNTPAFKVLGNKILLAIAELLPNSPEKLKAIHPISEKLLRRHSRGLLEAIDRGKQSKPLTPPKRHHNHNDYPERVEALREWRKMTAINLRVESDIVLPRDLMLQIALDNPKTKQELSDILKSTPWRLEHYGTQIQHTLENL